MGKSLDFVKERITSGLFKGIDVNSLSSMRERDFLDCCNFILTAPLPDEWRIETETGDKLNVRLKYDTEAKFAYVTSASLICDGTLFYMELYKDIVQKLFEAATCNAMIGYPSKLNGATIQYTVGNFVIASQFSNNFTTDERPWFRERQIVMLPIKYEILNEGE